ncbi:IclR family transcriptional regulator [Citricoccus muralis]|uniref:IclR family transcriptional regulator n=1 Tax=Citricoccus muralis TaxID=169134 RepID=A0ABY8H999_9MICC|nr:IclR family transcriptional regulator [Citricoccus muralis]WFP17486.1 IclR family transcriptional regulator [Citricoccus muralis]
MMGIQSVDRAVEIMEALTQGPSTVGAIAERLDVHKSTASRILSSLADHGLVEKSSSSGAYSLGFALVRFASAVTRRMDLSDTAQKLCDEVSAALKLTANVAILDEVFAVNVSQAVGGGLLAPRHYVGLRTPGHATSSGKVLLAHDEVAAEAALSDVLEPHTERTITDPEALRAELETVRAQGWAASNEEWEQHITAVAVPLRLHDGRVEATLTVTGPTHSLPPESFAEVAQRMLALAAVTHRWT